MLANHARAYLHRLCLELPPRPTGAPGNRAATDFFAATVAGFGWAVERPAFDCLDWHAEGASLLAGAQPFEALPSPYSPACAVTAPLRAVETVEALEAAAVAGDVLLLHGAIAREPLMPKRFPFYNPDEHQRLYRALEAARPAAVLTASARHPEMAGALYPYPMLEDGDFDIPSAYLTAEAGAALAAHAGQPVSLAIQAERCPAQGCNVVARRGPAAARRVVLMAHIDAKATTPGAIDNASGVVTLLLLAELLSDYAGALGIEMVAMNGEDNYAVPGERLFLEANTSRFDDIVLGINLDGLGYREGRTAYSIYNCPPSLAAAIDSAFAPHPGLAPGEPWYQGDHGLFLFNNCPALALTSERVADLMARIVHTAQDTPDLVDPARLAEAAHALKDLIAQLAS